MTRLLMSLAVLALTAVSTPSLAQKAPNDGGQVVATGTAPAPERDRVYTGCVSVAPGVLAGCDPDALRREFWGLQGD